MPRTVQLFVTCLVDTFFPKTGQAIVEVLTRLGVTVEFPSDQTCCGQPAYNNGDRKNAQQLARQVIDEFSDYDYVVVPSGSCGGMIKCHYPELLADDEKYSSKVDELAKRCYELTDFLVNVAGLKLKNVSFC